MKLWNEINAADLAKTPGIQWIFFVFVFMGIALQGCEPDRQLVPDTHSGKVPEVINLLAKIDTTAVTKKKVVKLSWAYDTLKYSTDRDAANLQDWDVMRSVGDSTFFQSRGKTLVPSFVDSSSEAQPSGKDVILFYKIIATGFSEISGKKVQFDGKPSDILQVTILKK